MKEIFTVTFSQVFILFIFITLGFLLKCFNKIPSNFSKGLSNLVVTIFLPFLTFGTFADNFKLNVLADKSSILIISSILLLLHCIIAIIFARIFSKNSNEYDVFKYSFNFPNSGYIGNPLMLAIFGEAVLFDFMVFCIPFITLTYTYGIYTLNPNKSFSLKNLLNPIIISMLLGMVSGATNLKIPSVLNTVIKTGGNCMAPLAMILTGIIFASYDLKDMVSNHKIYIACVLKLIIIPILAIFTLKVTNIPENHALLIIAVLVLPTGLNSIVFPESYGGDSKTGAQLCFASTTICLVSIPIMFALL